MKTDSLDIRVTEVDCCLYVSLLGELDLATAPRLASVERTVACGAALTVHLDLTDLGYIDSTGLMHLVRIYRLTRNHAGSLTVRVREGSLVCRVIRLIGAGELFPVDILPLDDGSPPLDRSQEI